MAGVILGAVALTVAGYKYQKNSRRDEYGEKYDDGAPAEKDSIMSSKLIPSSPDEVMVIRDLTPNVVTFSVPFLRYGRLPIGGRGTLGELPSSFPSNVHEPSNH